MTSLRARLLAGLLSASTLVLAANGVGLWVVVRTRLVGELDRSLVDSLRSNAPAIAREALTLWRARLGLPGPGGRRPGGPVPPRDEPRRPASERFGPAHRPTPAAIPVPTEREDLLFQARGLDGELLLASVSLGDEALPRLAQGLPPVTFDDIDARVLRFASLTLPDAGGGGRAAGLALLLELPADRPATGRGSGRPRPPGARPAPPPIEIVMAIDGSAVARTLSQLRWLLVLGWLAASTVGAVVIVWLLHRGLAPLSVLREQIEGFDETALEQRFAVQDAPSELLPVVDQLNALVGRMAAALTREQEFAGHAAHELRTPLAGLRATLELTLGRTREPAEHVAAAEQCLAITLQMQQMVEVLLEILRNPSPRRSEAAQTLSLETLLEASWAPWADRAAERRLLLAKHGQDSDTVLGDERRLRLILTNLLGNAVDHGDDGSTIEVTVRRSARHLELTVSNLAHAASPDIAAQAMRPFWRGDSARADSARHSGLGLTLCQRLAASLGGELTTAWAGGRFLATLSLPDESTAAVVGDTRDEPSC